LERYWHFRKTTFSHEENPKRSSKNTASKACYDVRQHRQFDHFRTMSSSAPKQPWWREVLTFSKSERIGILFLLVLVVSVWWVPAMFGRKKEAVFVDTRIDSLANSLPPVQPAGEGYVRSRSEGAKKNNSSMERIPDPFPFDPNVATTEEWQRLGLSDRTITTIQRFRDKGGRFRKPADIMKIYGLHPSLAAQLMPYVRIPSPQNMRHDPPDSLMTKHQFSKAAPRILDINKADSADWESLPGIGPTLAGRIIKYRNKLGGFHTITQVGETYGLADSVFRRVEKRLQLGDAQPSGLIPVNSATFEQLSNHPYIPFRLAKAIISYRDQHGPYKRKEDLMRIAIMTTEALDKMMPYLQFDQ
jgi:DNA uptake protein ComE-like DNA-binding protein